MSIRGLYDSEIGDVLARKTLAPFYKDEQTKRTRPGRSRRPCACGNETARPYIMRKGKFVCRECAATIPRVLGGSLANHKCVKCRIKLSRVALVVRKGKLLCKVCAKEF